MEAKRYASFSGSMRNRLIKWMDQIGLAKALNLETCITLFNDLDDKTIHTNFKVPNIL